MAGILYGLAVFALGLWLAREVNGLGVKLAGRLAGARTHRTTHGYVVRWADGQMTLKRVAWLYAGGMLANVLLLLLCALAMAGGLMLNAGGGYPREAASMVTTMTGDWLGMVWTLMGLPFNSTYLGSNGLVLSQAHGLLNDALGINTAGDALLTLGLQLGQVTTVYLAAASVLPMMRMSSHARAFGTWVHGYAGDPGYLFYREFSKIAYGAGAILILLVEGYGLL